MAREIDELWRLYAATGPGSDAPVYRAVADFVAEDDDLLAVATAAPSEAHHPNHLLAAVRYLLLGGLSHPLGDAYEAGDVEASIDQFKPFVMDHRDAILEVLEDHRVQTNEVGRTSAIAPALVHVARSSRSDLGLLEVGASAGLNLLVDRCYLDYGSMRAGDATSPIHVSCEVDGPPPAFGMVDLRLQWRLGLDRSPIDVNDEQSVRWLLACVWVGQTERQQRLSAALDLARADGVNVVHGDAARDVSTMVNRVPEDMHAVVLTSWVAFYLDRPQREAFERALSDCGRPVSWLSVEHPGVVADINPSATKPDREVTPSVVAHVSFDGGVRSRTFLGWAHPHGSWLDWHQQDWPGE